MQYKISWKQNTLECVHAPTSSDGIFETLPEFAMFFFVGKPESYVSIARIKFEQLDVAAQCA